MNAPLDALIAQGQALLEQGQLEAGVGLFDQAIALAPGDGGGWAGRAMGLRALGRHAEAVVAYDEVVKLAPHVADFWFERADSLECVDRLPESLASYDRCLELEPARTDALVDRGHVLHRLKRHSEAIASYERALKLKPDSHLAWFNKAEQERILGLETAAIRSYLRFFQCVPEGFQPTFLDHARTQLQALMAAPASEPVPDWVRLSREAEAHAQAGRLDQAVATYREAVAQAGEAAAKVLHNLGVMLETAERYDEAAKVYHEALKQDAKQAWSWARLGGLMLRKRRFREASIAYERAADVEPTQGDHFAGRAAALIGLHRFEDALDAATQACELSPGDLGKLTQLAVLQHKLGRFQSALATLKRVPDPNPFVRWLTGSCLLALEQTPEALAVFEAIPGDGHDGVIDRGVALERLGRQEEALASFQRGHAMSGRMWYHRARLEPEHATDYYGRAVEALSAEDRMHGSDPIRAAELADARAQLKQRDPERFAEVTGHDNERRAELGLPAVAP